jgi:hypothetical protein
MPQTRFGFTQTEWTEIRGEMRRLPAVDATAAGDPLRDAFDIRQGARS